jgi:F-type H+-transporting ATPase subunit delta
VAALLANPELGRDDAVALLAPVSHGETYSRFLAILAESHRLPLLPEIAGMFDALRAEAEHVVKATVTSAPNCRPASWTRSRSRCASASTARST